MLLSCILLTHSYYYNLFIITCHSHTGCNQWKCLGKLIKWLISFLQCLIRMHTYHSGAVCGKKELRTQKYVVECSSQVFWPWSCYMGKCQVHHIRACRVFMQDYPLVPYDGVRIITIAAYTGMAVRQSVCNSGCFRTTDKARYVLYIHFMYTHHLAISIIS